MITTGEMAQARKIQSAGIAVQSWALMIVLFAVLCLVRAVGAQGEADTVISLPGIEIETSVDLAEIYIGDLITYKVTITHDSAYELTPPPLGANLGAFDVKDYQPDITEKLSDGRFRSETIFSLTTFTTGDYIIPPLPVLFILPDSSRKILLAEAVPIKVKSLLTESGDSLDIRPAKAQYEFARPPSQYYLWAGLAFILLAAAMMAWVLLRRKKSLADQIDLRPPWEIAFEKLARLKERNLPEAESYKQYYFELTEIAREYLGRMYDADVLEMTTQEFQDQFRDSLLPHRLYDQSTDFLAHADLVKFARLVPELERTQYDFDFAHELVESVRVDSERRRQQEMVISGGISVETPVTERETS